MTGDIPYYEKMHKAFLSRLSREEFKNVEILLQKPYPNSISWSNAARKMIAVDVDLIVTYGTPATMAVMQEKTNIPVVFAGVYSTDTIGISGKNITGAISKVPVSSLIRYLKNITAISNLGVLYSEIEKDSVRQAAEIETLSRDMGFKAIKISIRDIEDVRKIANYGRLDALFLTCSAAVNLVQNSILHFAKTNRIPTASVLRNEYDSGIIVTLSSSPEEQGEIAAEKVSRILRGASPGTIAQTSGKNIELIFNLKESMSMGYKISMPLITEATKIIQ